MKEEEQTSNVSLARESQAIEEDFINTYRKLTELWDTDDAHYTNKYRRNAALDVLLKIVKRWNPDATRYHVRQKINVLRCCYRKDLKKYLASKCIGPNGEEIYEREPKNWKFHALRFLDKEDTDRNEIVQINLDESNFNDEGREAEGSVSEHDEPSPQASEVLMSPEPFRESYKNINEHKRLKLGAENEYFVENDDTIAKELDAVGANVTCKLKRMDPLQRYHAELLINKVLITGLKNNLTDYTDLSEVYKS